MEWKEKEDKPDIRKKRFINRSNLYEVVSGDSYRKIAQKLNVDIKDLRRINNSISIREGLFLVIPETQLNQLRDDDFEYVSAASRVDTQVIKREKSSQRIAEKKYREYQVRRGDTIWTIAERFGVSQKALMNLNGISDPRKLRPGQRLKVPRQS